MILGFDPGRDKCGLAVMEPPSRPDSSFHIAYAEVVSADDAIATVADLVAQYPISLIVMGDQTLSKTWKHRVETFLAEQSSKGSSSKQRSKKTASIPVRMVDERYSTLEARERYWVLHPAQGLVKFIPQSLRTIPRPIDDVVAIILIERYWRTLETPANDLSVSSVP